MIKLIAAEHIKDREIRLRFSDRSVGIFDFTAFVDAGKPMTEPLRNAEYFRRFYLELGALCWPNGFELSAGSLQRKLEEAGKLQRPSEAA